MLIIVNWNGVASNKQSINHHIHSGPSREVTFSHPSSGNCSSPDMSFCKGKKVNLIRPYSRNIFQVKDRNIQKGENEVKHCAGLILPQKISQKSITFGVSYFLLFFISYL